MLLKNLNYIFFIAMISLLIPNMDSIAQIEVSENDFNFISNQPLQEKIYAHTDKDFYLVGEILWFRLYDVSADSLKLLDLSKVAYVEILNAQQKPVLQAMVALNDGSGAGSFYLTSSLASGNYIFRAYTNWMKNFGADAFFQKTIIVVNTLTPVKAVNTDSVHYDIGFYPEGGTLVQGTSNKIGFKVLNTYGYGVDCSGYITDENNQNIVSFSTLKFGMGSFYFTPRENHTYSAVVNINNKIFKKSLPATTSAGYAMHAFNAAEMLHVSVHSNNEIQQNVYLIACNNNHIQAAVTQLTDNDGNAVFTIERNKLTAGITHIVLLNSNKQPVSERLVFTKPQTMQLVMSADKDVYSTRSEVTIQATPTNNANLSLSVFKIDSLQAEGNNSIISNLYLLPAVRGNIESPQYYFNNNSAEADSALENLLLTQGCSGFTNNTHSTQPVLQFAPEHEGHIIEGTVVNKTSGLPAKNIRVYASAPGLYYRFASAVSNDSGKVFFDIKDYYGPGELVVQTAKEDSMYRVDIADPFSNETSSWHVGTFNLPENNLRQLSNYNLAMQVQNAYSLNQLNIFNRPPVDTNAFYGRPDAKYFLDDYTRFNTMEEVLREYVANVDVRIKQDGYSVLMVDPQSHVFFRNNPLVLIDGVPVFDMNKLMAYNPLKIKKAEVVLGKYYLNALTADGILSYSTYKGNLDGFQFEPGTTELAYDGLQLEREFYAPKYITIHQQQSRLPDYRNVLYWRPQITANGNTQFSFYTSDVKGKYIAVIQGIDENGKAGYSTTEFEVK